MSLLPPRSPRLYHLCTLAAFVRSYLWCSGSWFPASATSCPSRLPRTRIKPIAPGWTWLDLDVTRFRRGIAQANARRLRLVGYRHTHPQGVARLPGAAIAGFGYLRQGAAIARLP